ncbi:MAG: TetR/AcrR family transcriptional regulator [Pseudomonadota bacterium]
MAGKREALRQDLTNRLIEAATNRIITSGLNALRARQIAEDAKCALGTIYKCFADFDDLILHVNSRTLAALGAALKKAMSESGEGETPLEILAVAYMRFAKENTHLWAALFEHRMPQNVPVPDWHLEEHSALFDNLSSIISGSSEGLSAEEANVRARTYFSAIHGIVSISLQDRFVGVPLERLEDEVRTFARAL